MSKEPGVGRTGTQSLTRALLILEAFGSGEADVGIRDLARELNTSPTTVFRAVAALRYAGYLEKDPGTGRYRLGPAIMKLAALYAKQNPLSEVGRRVFEKYSERFKYNFYLGALRNHEVVYLTVVDGRGPIKIVLLPGGHTALHATALGKVLLAYQSDEFINDVLGKEKLQRFTERTITDPDILRDQIPIIRQQRYALNSGEQYDEIAAVGVPVYDSEGRVIACASLGYPRELVGPDELDNIIVLTQEVAREITIRTGGIIPAVPTDAMGGKS